MTLALAILLTLAAVWDLRTHRIPNQLTLAGLAFGLAWHCWHEGTAGILLSLEGIGVASLVLLLYAVRGLGAGDVKLLGAVGALMGPQFLLWTLLGTMLAGGLLALGALLVRGARRKMPLAPAIALGAALAGVRLHGGYVL